MSNSKTILVALAGPSGSGKSTVEKVLAEKYHMKKLVSHTSRPMRKGEKDGEDYHFVSREWFEENTDKLLENQEFNGNKYGLSIAELSPEQPNVLVVAPHGLKEIIEKAEHFNLEVLVFYLYVPCYERVRRMQKRGDSAEDIVNRLAGDTIEQDIVDLNIIIDRGMSTINTSPEEIADRINSYVDYARGIKL